MNNNITLIVLCISAAAWAQKNDIADKDQLLLKEKKAFTKKMALGNNNPNTNNYDLRYQRLDLTINPAVNNISGSVTSHFVPTQNLSSLYFDFTNQMPVSSVTYHGNTVSFSQLPTKELRIDFAQNIPAGQLDSLTVNYGGSPDLSEDAVLFGNVGGSAVMSTLNEPYGAQDWFPTKQSLNDKVEKFDFKIITPATYSVASNGVLKSETILGNGQKLTHWQTNYPMAAYLAALSIGNFVKINDTVGTPAFPFVNYLYPATANDPTLMSRINWTKLAIPLFEQKFGPYPFRNEKYGHMEYNYGGVCMEHQTMSSMSSWNRGTIAHELAHQWFGDKVTCGTWNDIWLNEGFAVFGEHLVYENLLMNAADFQNYLMAQKNYITSVAGGSTYVPDAEISNSHRIFDGLLTYAKGGYVVRMMKWILTDEVFFPAIQAYHSSAGTAYGYATTATLKNSLLQITGRDFTGFFADWIYGQGYPSYQIRWTQLPGTLRLKVNQTQSHPSVSYFDLPLPIKVVGTAGEIAYFRPENTFNGEVIDLPVNFAVAQVLFNYENQIVERSSTVTQDASLAVQDSSTNSATVQLYPNPATSEVHVTHIPANSTYRIVSADGRVVASGKIDSNGTVKVSSLTSGNYVLITGEHSLKFIKR